MIGITRMPNTPHREIKIKAPEMGEGYYKTVF